MINLLKNGMVFRAESITIVDEEAHLHLIGGNVAVIDGVVYYLKINKKPYRSDKNKMQIVFNGEILFDNTI